MNNDHDGFIDDPRPQQPEETRPGNQSIEKQDAQSCDQESLGNCHDNLTREENHEIVQIEEAMQSLGIMSSWSGLLPAPNDFTAYPPEVQKKMIEWNDATIIDESKRQDELTKEKIRDGKRSRYMSFVVQLVFIIGAFVAFVITDDPNVFWVFTILGATIIGNVVLNIYPKNKKEPPEE